MGNMDTRMAVFEANMNRFGTDNSTEWCDRLKCLMWWRAWECIDDCANIWPPYGVDERPVIYWGA
jgi:hypothetical protein